MHPDLAIEADARAVRPYRSSGFPVCFTTTYYLLPTTLFPLRKALVCISAHSWFKNTRRYVYIRGDNAKESRLNCRDARRVRP